MSQAKHGLKKRWVQCDFYHVGADGPRHFPEVMNQIIQAYPSAADRSFEMGEGRVRVHEWHEGNDSGHGVLLHLRPDEDIQVADLETDYLGPIPLGDTQETSRFCCFMYVEEAQTLVVHRHRAAGGAHLLSRYIGAKADKPGIDLLPMLTAAGFRDLERMREFTVAEFKIAMPENLQLWDEFGDGSVRRAIELAQETGARTVSVRLSVGGSKGRLKGEATKNLLMALRGNLGRTKTAKVRGRSTDDGGLIELDLLHNRLQESVEVTYSGRGASIAEIHRALQTAYRRRRKDVLEQFAALGKDEGGDHDE